MNTTRQVDWAAEQQAAATLTWMELHNKVRGLLDGIEWADGFDRSEGTNHGGYYRDQLSVVRQEIAKRAGLPGYGIEGRR